MSGRKQIAIAFAVLTAVFAGLLYRAEHRTDQVNQRVAKVESPCLRYGSESKQCYESFSTALKVLKRHPELACFIVRQAGLNPDHCQVVVKELRDAREASVAKGVVPSTGHSPSSQPGPSGGHVGGGTGHQPASNPPSTEPPSSTGASNPPRSTETTVPPPTEQSDPTTSTPETPSGVIESANNGVLAPTVEKLPEPVKPVVEQVCSVAAHLAHLC